MAQTKKTAAAANKKAAAVTKYSKEQLLQARRFSQRKDLLNALLVSNKQYTIDEVDAAIKDFMKGKVE